MHLKRIAILAAFLTVAAGTSRTYGVPAYPGPVTYTQSDGTRITIRIYGDEFSGRVVSQEGYTLVGGPDGDYYFAELAPQGYLKATSVKAKPVSALTVSERAVVGKLAKGIRANTADPRKNTMRYSTLRVGADGRLEVAGPDGAAPTGRTGKLKSLVILVNFSDVKFITPNPHQAFTDMLNQDGYSVNGATGSAWNYYHDNSNGKFDPQFDVYGPYDLSRPMSYYGSNSYYQKDTNAAQMIVEACRLAAADGVDFSQYADGSNVRDIFVFYAGYNEAEGGPANSVWPHKWNINYATGGFSSNGASVSVYACSSELKGSQGQTMAGIGTFCHEFGHVIGWPDLYDTDYEQNGYAFGAGPLSLMDTGSYMNDGRTPPTLGIFERWTAGWAEPVEIKSSGKYTLEPVDKGAGYIVNTSTKGEFFIFENRNGSSFKWNRYLLEGDPGLGYYAGGNGMMVFHVDQSDKYLSYWEGANTVNAYSSHECYRMVKSKPKGIESPRDFSNSRNWFFPGESEVTSFTASTTPAFVSWKRQPTGVEFRNISVSGDNIIINVAGADAIELTAAPSQFDAMLTWEGGNAGEWLVEWKKEGSETAAGSKTVKGNSLHVSGLSAGTSYTVDVTPRGAENGVPQEFEFRTASVSQTGTPRFNALKPEYANGEYITLSLLDFHGDVSGITWYIDGEATEDTYLTLAPGEHRIMAEVENSDGTKEYLIRYVTVNK